MTDYPLEWDIITRPIIAKLYKAGIIQNAYASRSPGRDSSRDLYLDLRVLNDDLQMKPSIEMPPPLSHLLTTARAFAHKHGDQRAHFAVLRLWSAPRFYPLMIGLGNRVNTEFTEGLGREWEWCFMPKDMPGSEMSIHYAVRLRLERFEHLFDDGEKKVVVMRDLFLVMGVDEQELWRLAVVVTLPCRRSRGGCRWICGGALLT